MSVCSHAHIQSDKINIFVSQWNTWLDLHHSSDEIFSSSSKQQIIFVDKRQINKNIFNQLFGLSMDIIIPRDSQRMRIEIEIIKSKLLLSLKSIRAAAIKFTCLLNRCWILSFVHTPSPPSTWRFRFDIKLGARWF